MTTLRDLWIAKGMTSADVASATKVRGKSISVPTLYACNRKEGGVSFATVQSICKVLNITLEEYANLEVCSQAASFKKGEKK